MDVTLETLGPTARALRVELPAERFAGEVERRLRRLARTLRVKGFRPGKVPLQVVRQRHLQEVYAEAVRTLVRESLPEALRREALSPVLEPRVDVEAAGEDRPLRYRAGFDVFPALDPARVARLELQETPAAVADAEVAAALEQLRRRHADWTPAGRPAAAGDRARLVYELGDPPPPLGEKSPQLELDLAEGAGDPALRAAVLGGAVGDEREADLGGDGPGGACRFRIEAVEVPRLPAWDDAEFLRRCGAGDGGREELTAAARRHLEGRAVEYRRAALRRQVVRGLAGDGADMLPVPESLQAWCLELRAREAGAKQAADVPAEHPLRAQALEDAREATVLRALQDAGGAAATEADLERVLEQYAQQFRDPERARREARQDERVRGHLEREAGWDALLRWVAGRARVRPAEKPAVESGA